MRHAGDEVAQNGRTHHAVDAQFAQFLDKTQLLQDLKSDMLDADRTRLGLLQGVDIDLLKVWRLLRHSRRRGWGGGLEFCTAPSP